MKYAIDKIENNIAVLEDIETKEKKEVNIELLPEDIKEGTIVTHVDNQYLIDTSITIERSNNLRNRFNSLKRK